MGAITPIATGLSSIVSTIGAVSQAVNAVQTLTGNDAQSREQDLALKQLQQRQALEAQQTAQDNALQRETIATQTAQAAEDRQAALRRAVARQRASFGSSGIGSGGGSASAVLLGLFDESEEDLAQREALDNLRTRALDLNASQAGSLNLLQSTQLQQRQNLNNATLFDRLF